MTITELKTYLENDVFQMIKDKYPDDGNLFNSTLFNQELKKLITAVETVEEIQLKQC